MMAIKRDLSSLPRAARPGGNPPLEDSKALRSLMRAWEELYEEAGQKELTMAIPGLPFRGSFASKRCDRQLHYAMSTERCLLCDGGTGGTNPMVPPCPRCGGTGVQQLENSDPLTITSYWNFAVGTAIHDALQAAAERAWPGAVREVKVDLRPVGVEGSASADVVVYGKRDQTDVEQYTEPPVLFNVELKSTGGYSFKMVATDFDGPPQGPKWGAVVQGALANRGLGAEKLLVGYFASEMISVNVAKSLKLTDLQRFTGMWEYSAEECDEIVRDEAARIGRVLMFQGTDILPPREIHDPEFPVGATVQNPAQKGMWVVTDQAGNITQTGKYWGCDYCDQRTRCIEDGPGGVEPSGSF